MKTARLTALLALGLGALACTGNKLSGNTAQTCKVDADCAMGAYCNGAGFCQVGLACTPACAAPLTCDLATGACDCQKSSDCPVGLVCSALHTCQVQQTCNSNGDCPADAGVFCDTVSGTCIPAASCGQDQNCPLGEGCSNGSCAPGCVNDGDCPQVDYSQSPPVFTPYACLDFTCVKNGCHGTANCPFLDYCDPTSHTCQAACPALGPLCTACDSNTPCPGSNSLCLYDDRDTPGCQSGDANCLFFCGQDCSQGQACPSGTYCSVVGLVSGQAGTSPADLCSKGQLCQGGPTPLECPVPEGATQGSCPCYSDGDCSALGGRCDQATGSCYDGKQCAPSKQYQCPAGGGQCQGG